MGWVEIVGRMIEIHAKICKIDTNIAMLLQLIFKK